MSSSSTHGGQPFMSHYVAAKSGVVGSTKSLALEFGPKEITAVFIVGVLAERPSASIEEAP